MKVIIFAGGTGTRLWPLSRKKSPKQFEKIIGDKSTLQLAYDRLLPEIKAKDIYISTNIAYKKTIFKQLPKIPRENFIFEPEKKDVCPAIALSMGIFYKMFPDQPVALLWSDHLIKRTFFFKKLLMSASEYIRKNKNKIVLITHKPRFASTNLGYIRFGKNIEVENGIKIYEFRSSKYRPNKRLAKKYFNSEEYGWNLGYFVTTPRFMYGKMKIFAPKIYRITEEILSLYGKKGYNRKLKEDYKKMKSINFDNAILEKLNPKNASVIVENIGWSDVGAWELLKEALERYPYENIIRGEVFLDHVRDSLIYNYEKKKLVVGIDLDEIVVVNTNDVLLIAKKRSVSKIKQLVSRLKGTKNENLI